MQNQIIIIAVMALFLIIGLLEKRKKIDTMDEYSLNRQELGWFPIMAGVSMTYAGGGTLVAQSSMSYQYGWQGMVDGISVFLGGLIVLFFIDKYRKDKGITMANFLSSNHQGLSTFIGFVTTIFYTIILASQFLALSKVLGGYFPNIESSLLIVFPSLLIFSYVFFGGFSSVTKTDVLQLIFVVSFYILPVLYLWIGSEIEIERMSSSSFEPMPLNIVGSFLLMTMLFPFSQDVNIRAKSAKSKKHAIVGIGLGIVLYVIISFISVSIGVILAKDGIALNDSEGALSLFFSHYYPTVGIFAILAILAAIISTLDSMALNAITSLSNDILLKTSLFKKSSSTKLINMSGIIIFLVAISIALFFNQVLDLILMGIVLYVAVIAPIALGKRLNISDDSLLISSILSVVLIVSIEMVGDMVELKAFVYPLMGIVLMLIVGWWRKEIFISKNNQNEKEKNGK